MRAATAVPSLFLTFLAPSFATASWFDGNNGANQLTFDVPAIHRVPSVRPNPAQGAHSAAAANPSVVVHVVDPASPSTSSAVTPSSLSDDNDDEDHPLFGATCTFESTFTTCGDYFDEASGLDHGLFCSPSGVCGGKGAACGASEACAGDLVCNTTNHRCTAPTAELLRAETSRAASRRKAAVQGCPEGATACPTGLGGFQCVHTLTDDLECGACVAFGGRVCSAIPNALATSCRGGSCRVHACVGGYQPNEEGTDCVDELLF
ncbi:hypothetical protein JCM8097_009190 [Rhodosporidiobolus ruineniae]